MAFINENFFNLQENYLFIDIAKKLKAYQDLIGEKLTVMDVSKILEDFYRDSIQAPTPDLIIEETAKFYNLSVEDIKGKGRTQNVSNARQIAMYIIKTLTNFTLVDIGDVFSGRDHSTVLTSIRKVEETRAVNREYSQTIKDIISNINSKN